MPSSPVTLESSAAKNRPNPPFASSASSTNWASREARSSTSNHVSTCLMQQNEKHSAMMDLAGERLPDAKSPKHYFMMKHWQIRVFSVLFRPLPVPKWVTGSHVRLADVLVILFGVAAGYFPHRWP